ncbi:MAG: hypothetical protein DRP15_03110 [Candidatus Aenigmatarchaeota archaeon]|nr:MAG: hypothetical protein DRP15_03110 [Candidatus Aenigmarchaeota archaeon]
MGKMNGEYVLYILLGINILLLLVNFIVSFIFSLFLIMVLVSSGGYGSPEGKWQAYTVGTGNWRIGGVGAKNEDYSRTLKAEYIEKRRLNTGSIYLFIIALVIIISIVGLMLGYGSLLELF